MADQAQILPGTLDLLMLRAVSLGPLHGYGILQRIGGRAVAISKHAYTIIGVAPSGFQGTLLFVAPDFFMPMVNQEQVAAEGGLDTRASGHSVFETFGRLKPGVSDAQATADVNAIAANLARAYPHESTTRPLRFRGRG